MAKITICGDAVVVTSAVKLEDIKTIQKYRKSALTLMGGEDGKEPIFSVCAGTSGGGSINRYGAEFTSETRDEQKLAVMTLVCPDHDEDNIKEFVADSIGSYVATLNKLEAQLPEVLREIASERQAIMDNITVTQ